MSIPASALAIRVRLDCLFPGSWAGAADLCVSGTGATRSLFERHGAASAPTRAEAASGRNVATSFWKRREVR